MALLNEFGKKKWNITYNSAALNAGKVWDIQPTDTQTESYAPFNRLIIWNYNTSVTIEIRLNASGLGDDTMTAGTFTAFILPSAMLEIEPQDNLIFNFLAIKNKDAAVNMSANDLAVKIQNY